MSPEFESELSNHFKGLKRTLATEAAAGVASVKVGKDPLQFRLYRKLCELFLNKKSASYAFGRCFLILCWNLMCRAGNAVNIHFGHLEWREDSLGIFFAHMKNDQLGERPR